nr:hypothetical protein [Tanacetum cinerariifolium]
GIRLKESWDVVGCGGMEQSGEKWGIRVWREFWLVNSGQFKSWEGDRIPGNLKTLAKGFCPLSLHFLSFN